MKKLTSKAPGTTLATLKTPDGKTRNVVLHPGFSEPLLSGEVVVSITAPEGQYTISD